jgi:hypothetical protein
MESVPDRLVNVAAEAIHALAQLGYHTTFVYSTAGNRLEIFDLNQGRHFKADHVIQVPHESEVMDNVGIDRRGNSVNEEETDGV